MLKTRMKRVADLGDHAVRRLAEIKASIADLSNEDLLDLADIFKAEPRSPIGDIAFVEMAAENQSLEAGRERVSKIMDYQGASAAPRISRSFA